MSRNKSCSQATLVFSLLMLFPLNKADGSDFGTNGLFDIPTARGSGYELIKFSGATQARTTSYALTYQPTPWLETTFRYTGWKQANLTYDRNYEMKLRLLEESVLLPEISIGIRDMFGTGIWGSEYLVASKKIRNFDLTLGLGWGRLAGKSKIKNPLGYISDDFFERSNDYDLGGKLSTNTFFRGNHVGLFGGFKYEFNDFPIALLMEYNPDRYDWEFIKGGKRPKSSTTFGFEWLVTPQTSIKFSSQHRDEWGISFSTSIDTSNITEMREPRSFKSSLDLSSESIPVSIDPSSWYDMLLLDAERSGLLLLEASLDRKTQSVTMVIGNIEYSMWRDAIRRMSNLADMHVPSPIRNFIFIIEENGYRLHSVHFKRESISSVHKEYPRIRNIHIAKYTPQKRIDHRTSFITKKILLDINLATRFQLFDPQDPLRYQLYGKFDVNFVLPRSWILTGVIDLDIYNNFDESTRISDSRLPHVRSDIVEYLKDGATGIESLFIGKRGNLKNDVYYRIYMGVLESMYSGMGGEILFQPFQSRLALGLSMSYLVQRQFDRQFKHFDYRTNTVFGSVYWASPFYNFDFALHVGKYLAKDKGATLEIRKTFDNGWMVGLWATKTDVSAEDFGEGSFDKGLFLRVPFQSLFGGKTRSSYTARLRPVQRDGGQRLEDFSGTIWWDIRSARYDAINKSRIF